jgi:phosphoglycolate phosphatase
MRQSFSALRRSRGKAPLDRSVRAMFKLSDLLAHDGIVIQCHNIPDADTLASAFAVHEYLRAHGKSSRIVYSGFAEITKPNLLEMVEKLRIPVEYVKPGGLPHLQTLVLVDCQHGEKNVASFTADTVFVIDHHPEVKKSRFEPGQIHPYLGSCSTLVWHLASPDFNFRDHSDVATALYFGLFTDTGKLEEIAHPLDRDARDNLQQIADMGLIDTLRNNNLTLEELAIAGRALIAPNTNLGIKYAIFCADQCDPNILGFVGDLATEASGIDVCVVYSELPNGCKLSVRSCTKSVMADEFAKFLAGDANAGGHIRKAGGFIPVGDILSSVDMKAHLEQQVSDYFSSYHVIEAANHNLDTDDGSFKKYVKFKTPLGFVVTSDLFASGSPLVIRTLEGDEETQSGDDVYLMLGLFREIYPIKYEKWDNSYMLTDEMFANETDELELIKGDRDYVPRVINKTTGEVAELSQIVNAAQSCVAKGEIFIYARPLEKPTKVFTTWNLDGYMYGEPGDLLAVRSDDPNDVYIIHKKIFVKTYEEVQS